MSIKKDFSSRYFLAEKNLILFLVFITLSVLVMTIIFVFSHQTADVSALLSDGLSDAILDNIESDDSSTKALHFVILRTIIRKFAHLFLFTSLGVFLTGAAINFKAQKPFVKYLFVLLTGLVYGAIDEIHQIFIDGRSSEFIDVILDFSGVLLGVVFAIIFYKILQIIAKKRKIN